MSDDSHEYDEDALEFIEDERVRIAALHATCPKVIWLQVDPEAEQFDGWDAQTWCSDKINDTDVRYVLGTSRDAEVAELRSELETEQMRNVACGVVAIADTPDSAKQARDMHPDYMSAACQDVARRVDECIKLREQVKMLRSYLEAIIDPIEYMRAKLEEGYELNGSMAVQLSQSHTYLKGLAKEALAATEPKP